MRIDSASVDLLARGCSLLGGGTDLAPAIVLARRELERAPVEVVDLEDVDAGDEILVLGAVGDAAAGAFEGGEAELLAGAVERSGARPAGIMAAAVGGAAGLLAAAWAARLELPLVDADASGGCLPARAYGALAIPHLSGPLWALADAAGNVVTVDEAPEERDRTLVRRAAAVLARPSAVGLAHTQAQARESAVPGTVSWALALGRAAGTSLDAVLDVLGALVLADGKVAEVRRTGPGRRRHVVVVSDLESSDCVCVECDGVALVAYSGGRVAASVPDLLVLADGATGAARGARSVETGERVAVLAAPAAAHWRSPDGLAAAGPQAFGYAFEHRPVDLLRGRRPGRPSGSGSTFRAAARPAFCLL
jgi:DUF917 family protein